MTIRFQKGIHVVMPAKLLAKWLRRLNDPRTKRDRGALLIPESGGMCCLGVMQVAATGSTKGIQRYSNSRYAHHKTPMRLPTLHWLTKHGIYFWDRNGKRDVRPYLPELKVDAAEANDGCRYNTPGKYEYTFKDIAKAIKATAKGV